jgi:hypothetical protein
MATPAGVAGYEGLVEKALDFKAKDLWFCFGMKTTAWDDNDAPPAVLPADNSANEQYLWVQATQKTLCILVDEETYLAAASDERVTLGGVYYVFVDDADAYTNYARYLYVRCLLDTNAGLPPGTFRQVKIFSGTTQDSGPGATWVLPENVTSNGKFRWGRNYPTRTLIQGEAWTSAVVIEER